MSRAERTRWLPALLLTVAAATALAATPAAAQDPTVEQLTPAEDSVTVGGDAADESVDESVDEAVPTGGDALGGQAEDDAGGACDDRGVLLRPGCQVMEGVLGGISGVVEGGATAALRAMVEWVVDAAGWLLGQLASLIDATTTPDVQAGWFDAAYGQMTVIAVTLMLPLVLLSTIQALLRSDAAQLTRVFFVYVPVATLGMFAATAVVAMLLAVTDELSVWVGTSIGGDLAEFTTNIGTALTATTAVSAAVGPQVPGFAALLAALIVGFATLVIWVLLVLRQAAVYAGVLFLPLAFAGLVWPAAGVWFKRLAEGLVAIIFSKFVIVAVLAMASSALAAAGVTEGFGVVVAGGSLLLMAVFAPFVLLRLIPVFGSELASALDGVTNQRTSPVPASAGTGVYRQIAAANSARAAAAGPGGLLIAGGAAATGAATATANKVKGAAGDVAGHGHSGAPPSSSTSGGGSGAGTGVVGRATDGEAPTATAGDGQTTAPGRATSTAPATPGAPPSPGTAGASSTAGPSTSPARGARASSPAPPTPAAAPPSPGPPRSPAARPPAPKTPPPKPPPPKPPPSKGAR